MSPIAQSTGIDVAPGAPRVERRGSLPIHAWQRTAKACSGGCVLYGRRAGVDRKARPDVQKQEVVSLWVTNASLWITRPSPAAPQAGATLSPGD